MDTPTGPQMGYDWNEQVKLGAQVAATRQLQQERQRLDAARAGIDAARAEIEAERAGVDETIRKADQASANLKQVALEKRQAATTIEKTEVFYTGAAVVSAAEQGARRMAEAILGKMAELMAKGESVDRASLMKSLSCPLQLQLDPSHSITKEDLRASLAPSVVMVQVPAVTVQVPNDAIKVDVAVEATVPPRKTDIRFSRDRQGNITGAYADSQPTP